ncbi:TetR/AcrR family transcriptional regulator [Serpentinicella alkaliphila]|uniref:TetR family transcriptional regulator n=1 Tax=Serpentinicella alkaliphila TaxID=1734049 RepID=A0A4R2TZT4_9FIRM|nr:TetR/AcrR family transcriptional regulator [Serpentinicella alkaliphila]QUH25226.1 TetR/AcrR family transcriptional regulator [Serpentinicella alkaliphila]TCQ07035.1 TetR family transcriptional regulator [Serpentinicella alkaliphila]
MREIKDPEVRKAEIMEAAKNLFYKKGYLDTTTQDIINSLGISRGLLYYHFKSKEDILFSIVEKHIEPIIARFRLITYDNKLSAKEKVNAFLNSTIIEENAVNVEDYSLHEAIHLPENTFMMDKINHKLSYTMTEFFAEIITQGNREGLFNVKYPYETSAFLMVGYTFVVNNRSFHEIGLEKATEYLRAYRHLLNLTLYSDH